MYYTRKLTRQVWQVGGSDHRLALFENLFPITCGVSYNPYLILDEQIAVVDTVGSPVFRQFLENTLHTLDGRPLDYLAINHMEPDHYASTEMLLLCFPTLKSVGNAKTFAFTRQFYDFPLGGRIVIVKEGDALSLNGHTLQFHMTPVAHWPEVIMTYESSGKLLFSADVSSSFGATGGNPFNDELNFDRDWLDDARRYYGNVMDEYGLQVQAVLKKLSGLDIVMICPLHGPIWHNNLDYLLSKYDKWNRYEPEKRVVAVLHASMYGDTENTVNLLAAGLADSGVKNIIVHDIFSTHVSTLIPEVFRYNHLMLTVPTCNNGVHPAMATFLYDMKALGLQNRTVALVENGPWAPISGKLVYGMLGKLKDFQALEPMVSLKSALEDNFLEPLFQLRGRILGSLNG